MSLRIGRKSLYTLYHRRTFDFQANLSTFQIHCNDSQDCKDQVKTVVF